MSLLVDLFLALVLFGAGYGYRYLSTDLTAYSDLEWFKTEYEKLKDKLENH